MRIHAMRNATRVEHRDDKVYVNIRDQIATPPHEKEILNITIRT